MRIGNLNVEGRVFCAPMAGISTPTYRRLARRFGAAIVYSEMISGHGLVYENKKTTEMLFFNPEERPIGIQLFGADPEIMYKASEIVSKRKPDIIDLNFGCPVKKVVNKNGGAAVLKDPGLTRALIAAAVSGSNCPVTIKMRSGWDEESKNFIEAGQIAEDCGVGAITLHARTRSGKFSGRVCLDDIGRLKESVSVPVIGNGDVTCGADAARMLEETGCDAVMVGRAALGNPWIFREINHYLETGQNLERPSLEEKAAVIVEHALLLGQTLGEQRAMLHMRHNTAWYTKGWIGGNRIRRQITQLATYKDLEELLGTYVASMRTETRNAPDAT